MSATVKSGARDDVLVAVATAIVLCVELFVIASWSMVPRGHWRVVMLLIALTCLGLSVAGGFCAVRAFIRMKSFEGLLLFPILLMHLFSFYYGVAAFIEFVVPPRAPHLSQANHDR
jgi:hypothetical protein